VVSDLLIVSNQTGDGLPSEPFHRGDQPGEVRAGTSCGCEPCVVGLPRLRNRWVT
jgi:hypothetical protein